MDEDLKKCSKCKMECLKLNLYKDITRKMVCEFFVKPVLFNIITIVKSKEMLMKEKKQKPYVYFKLASFMRTRLYKAYKIENVKKLLKQLIYLDVLLIFLKMDPSSNLW